MSILNTVAQTRVLTEVMENRLVREGRTSLTPEVMVGNVIC